MTLSYICMKDFDATKEGGVRGTALIEELSAASGLPDDLIGEELSRIIAGAGRSTADVTLDDLREMLAAYLQDVLADAKDAFDEAPPSLETALSIEDNSALRLVSQDETF